MTPLASQSAHDEPAGSGRTILFIHDELKASGLPRRSRQLTAALTTYAYVILVAQCYLKPSHRARRLDLRHEFYGFPAATYDADVAAFAADLRARYRPACAVLYGWENAQLVVALEQLDVPVVTYTETPSNAPNAESQLNRSLRHSTEVLFLDPSIPASLTEALWGLESREYRVVCEVPSPPPAHTGRERMVRQLFQVRSRSSQSALIGVDVAAAALEQACRRAVDRCARRRRHAHIDAQLIEVAGGLNTDLALPLGANREDAIAIYLRSSDLTVPRDRVAAGRLLRRPIAGFNPMIYASDHPSFDEAEGEDPLAHYLRSGRPEGRWTHRVLGPNDAAAAPPGGFTAAIHAHLHYPEFLPELLGRLRANTTTADLIITTTSHDCRDAIAANLQAAGAKAAIMRVCENRGRDLWPFLSLLQEGVFDGYGIVGHFHGKRSPHFAAGHIWRDFLWTHLIGGSVPMIDVILAAFAADPKLGLVFAEEPHLEGWEKNLDMASEIAERAGLVLPLPVHFEYPMGTMFWTRPAALQPLRHLGLTRDDIPPEPLPIDGTLLHALERLIPFFVTQAGFGYATTHVPGSTR